MSYGRREVVVVVVVLSGVGVGGLNELERKAKI